MKHLFGPVPSRRLGISLGVDLVPYKVCSLNCIYCEVGRTTNLTMNRNEYIQIDEMIHEIEVFLNKKPELDYITFSGQGEPTLNRDLGYVINFIKQNYSQYKVALITNGTLFWNKKVRDDVLQADVILPSLDAVSNKNFHKINRPAINLENSKIIKGLIQLRKEFKGKIYLEIFFVQELNDTKEELILLKEEIQKIKPDLIQLNTLDRPGTDDKLIACSYEKLKNIKDFFKPLPTEIIAKARSRKKIKSFCSNIEKNILDTIKRRPCTAEDLTEILNIHINELNKYLSELIAIGLVQSIKKDRGMFFKIAQ